MRPARRATASIGITAADVQNERALLGPFRTQFCKNDLVAPTDQHVEAKIVELTAEIADQRIYLDWWADANLSSKLDPLPIDRLWNWNEMGIEYEGSPLAIQVAILTGDQVAQGAMMISTDPVPSILAPGKHALFVELRFTAPRNRPTLRRDAHCSAASSVAKPFAIYGALRRIESRTWICVSDSGNSSGSFQYQSA